MKDGLPFPLAGALVHEAQGHQLAHKGRGSLVAAPFKPRATWTPMRAPKKQIAARKAEKLRSWRATILRQRGEYLGTVEAADAKSAEALAIKTFGLDGQRRQRLVVREED
jgi:hypothetical protein